MGLEFGKGAGFAAATGEVTGAEAAFAGAGAAEVIEVEGEAVLDARALEAFTAAADVAAEAAYHACTPLWPPHAPRFEAAEVYVPSLHCPVEPAGACACTRAHEERRSVARTAA